MMIIEISAAIVLILTGIIIISIASIEDEPIGILGLIPLALGLLNFANFMGNAIKGNNCSHNQCDCETTYEKLYEENGINVFVHNNELYYYNPSTNTYVIIKQQDGTTFTYDEYAQEQLNK